VAAQGADADGPRTCCGAAKVICTQPYFVPARAGLAVACGIQRIHGAGQYRWQVCQHQEANRQSVVQLLAESFAACEGKPQLCNTAKAAAAAHVKPFGISPKEGWFWPERGPAEVQRRRLAVQSGAAPEDAKGQ